MNQLQHETSPYLLQHAHNPVDWYAWKPEAFERAQREQKPILVSIGYSTCHWCHVMERESFENEAVAAIMNRFFINIKVDREERPDVDAIYMEACQILTRGGGWPLNCFLTPEGKPFYAGTYFPPKAAYNRPSWTDLLAHLADIWENKRDTALEQAERLTGYLRKDAPPIVQGPEFVSKQPDIKGILTQIKSQFDPAAGGFGGAPKFPSSMAIQLLLEGFGVYRDPEALEQALFSLEKMICGGIYDQIGGGFSRYATDREWLVPHFEKMLYDNALLVGVLADAYKLVSDDNQGLKAFKQQYAGIFRETIEETLAYIAREMTSPDGGFYAAQDADSEGVEGKFYVWDKSEIVEILGADAPDFCAYYDVTESGNWEEKNILNRPRNPGQHTMFKVQRQKLLEKRSNRIWPLLDTKTLLDWNALMTTAHCKAFTALGHEAYQEAAIRNIAYIKGHLCMPSGEKDHLPLLKHSIAQPYAFLDDYAFFIAALTDVYEITFDEAYLRLAEQYAGFVLQEFADEENPLFFFAGKSQNDILLRKKDLYDNATPAGNSIMLHNLQRLGWMMDRADWREKAGQMMEAMQPSVEKFPLSFANWAAALLHDTIPPAEIAIVGADAPEKAISLQTAFLPNKIIAASREENNKIPLLAGKSGGAKSMIYLCRNFACQKPFVSLDEFWENMKLYFLLIFALLSAPLAAQQVPQYSLYNLNPYAFNPAYAGMEYTLVATGVYRQQWSGLKGAPVAQHINAHLPLYAINSGIGLRVENDVIGAHSVSQAVLSYNYQLQLGRNTILAAGLSAGYLQYALDGTKLRAPDGTYNDPDFSHNDQVIPTGKEQIGTPLFEVGVYLQAGKLEIGASVLPVYASKLSTGSGSFGVKAVQHGFFYTAYSIDLSENLSIKPSVLVKTDLTKTQAEISAVAKWRENIFAGVGYRGFGGNSKDAAILMAGLKLNEKTTLAYGFDVPLSALNVANRGSHELLLRYSLNKPIGVGKLPPVIYNPRFF
jgi:uncharacterized protein